MSLLILILGIALFGVLLWAINKFLPMDSSIKKLLNIVAVVALIIWLLKEFGVLQLLSGIKL